MKKFLSLLLALMMMSVLVSCDSIFRSREIKSTEDKYVDSESYLDPNSYSDTELVDYGDMLHKPITATLYKDGEKTELKPDDPRIIRLLNFYNCSKDEGFTGWTKGLINDGLPSLEKADFKLDMTFDGKPMVKDLLSPASVNRVVLTRTQFWLYHYNLTEDGEPMVTGENPFFDLYTSKYDDEESDYFNWDILTQFGF